MAVPAWFWPPSGASARGVSLADFHGLVVVPDWLTPTLWPFSPTGDAFLAGYVLATGTPGFVGAVGNFPAPEASTDGLLALTFDGVAYMATDGWPPSASAAVSMPSGRVYVGCAAGVSSSGYALSSDGAASWLTWNGGAGASGALGSWPAPSRFLAASGSATGSGTLATVLESSGVGIMAVPGGATGIVAFPSAIASASCIAMTSGTLAIGGWSIAPSLSGAAAAAMDPQNDSFVAAVGSGYALTWRPSPTTAVSGENWTQTQALTGLLDLKAMGWAPDGTQFLAASVSSGQVQAVSFIAGVMALAQTLAVSGACSVAVAGDSTHALVAQSGQSQLATLTYAGATWSTGAPVTGFPGVVAVVSSGDTDALVAWTSGISLLTLTTGGWVPGSSAATSFAPAALYLDRFGNAYAAGSGQLVVLNGSTLSVAGSGSWPGGTPTAVVAHEGRVVVAAPVDGRLYVLGESQPSLWTLQSSGSASAAGLGLSDTVLFAMDASATRTYGFSGTPYALLRVTSGAAAQWDGAAWTTTVLGIGHNPSCCAFDGSGNLVVATLQNTLWTVTSGGVGTSGEVPQYSPQPQTVPLGPSALLSSGGHLYATTSMPGVLVEVS